MKKQSLILITGAMLAFASCNTENAANSDDSQAKIDSMVNERVEQIRMELAAKNDSLIMEMAMYRADSIMAAMSGKKAPKRRTPAPKPQPTLKDNGGNSGDMSGNSGTNDNKFKSSSDANKQSGTDKFKSKSDANKESGASKFKSKAD